MDRTHCVLRESEEICYSSARADRKPVSVWTAAKIAHGKTGGVVADHGPSCSAECVRDIAGVEPRGDAQTPLAQQKSLVEQDGRPQLSEVCTSDHYTVRSGLGKLAQSMVTRRADTVRRARHAGMPPMTSTFKTPLGMLPWRRPLRWTLSTTTRITAMYRYCIYCCHSTRDW